jgi:hypothetical protein
MASLDCFSKEFTLPFYLTSLFRFHSSRKGHLEAWTWNTTSNLKHKPQLWDIAGITHTEFSLLNLWALRALGTSQNDTQWQSVPQEQKPPGILAKLVTGMYTPLCSSGKATCATPKEIFRVDKSPQSATQAAHMTAKDTSLFALVLCQSWAMLRQGERGDFSKQTCSLSPTRPRSPQGNGSEAAGSLLPNFPG